MAQPLSGFAGQGALHIAGAHLMFGQRTLFRHLSFALPPGSWNCLLGRSGCGKSSLLRLMAGLPVAAEAGLSMRDESGAAFDRRTAWMGQQDLLLPWRRVIDNVQLGAAMRGEPGDRERARTLLEEVGLLPAAQRYPQTLSGGERSRVALARTLYEAAPLVLMDEPFAALDAMTRLDLHALASRLLQGCRVLMVTHDPLEALRLSDRILFMRGSPATLERFAPPPGAPPRDPAAPEMSDYHARLLTALSQNHRRAMQPNDREASRVGGRSCDDRGASP